MHSKTKLRKELGFFDVFCIAAGAMISSGLFILPGLAYAKAGPAVLLSYIIAGALVIPALLSKVELSTAMPKAGGTYFFIDRSMGPRMGVIGGFATWFSLAFKSAFALLGIGAFTILVNPGLTDLQIKLIAVLFCIIFTIINIIGTKHTGKTQIVLVAGLLFLLVVYILIGIFHIKLSRFTPFAPYGPSSIFATAGFVFVSYGGLTKVASVAEEVRNPERNIPIGMLLAWSIVSLLYTLVIFVTIGVTIPSQLKNSLTPVSLGASMFMGEIGAIIMAIAAILAFVSTANAGLLAASRSPMAMGKDDLLPRFFERVGKSGTPVFSIIFTSAFMIFVILFLDIESLVKTASTLQILLFLFVTLSVIFMRESKIRHYQPKFKSPLYPWIQIAGIIGYGFLIYEMGALPLITVGIFILFGLTWYLLYARDKIKREYALLHVVERITGIKTTNYLLDEELREILIERDEITEKGFEQVMKKCMILDFDHCPSIYELSRIIVNSLAKKLGIKEDYLFRLMVKREEDSNIVVKPGIAIPSIVIKGRNKFDVAIVRCKKGVKFLGNIPPIHTLFIVISSPDKRNLYLHSLMWITQIVEEENFEEKWLNAADAIELRKILLDIWKRKKEIHIRLKKS